MTLHLPNRSPGLRQERREGKGSESRKARSVEVLNMQLRPRDRIPELSTEKGKKSESSQEPAKDKGKRLVEASKIKIKKGRRASVQVGLDLTTITRLCQLSVSGKSYGTKAPTAPLPALATGSELLNRSFLACPLYCYCRLPARPWVASCLLFQ